MIGDSIAGWQVSEGPLWNRHLLAHLRLPGSYKTCMRLDDFCDEGNGCVHFDLHVVFDYCLLESVQYASPDSESPPTSPVVFLERRIEALMGRYIDRAL